LDFSEHSPDDISNSDDEYTYTNGNGIVHAEHHPVVHRDNGYANGHPDNHVYKKKGSLHQAFKAEFETVGCTAVDVSGNCAAATSTGGLVNKMSGRIGKPWVNCYTFVFFTVSITLSLHAAFSDKKVLIA
jgi:hypothetical protein